MDRVVALVLAGGASERLSILSAERAKPAVPFGIDEDGRPGSRISRTGQRYEGDTQSGRAGAGAAAVQ
jgi:hypothetical protein